ncbi:GNAT family N-acetyltransferase, partial [Bacillus sp. D-CC]
MIQLHVYEEIVNFKEEVTPFLEKNEQENNLILGVLQMVQQPIFMGIAKQGGEIAVVFLQAQIRETNKEDFTNLDRFIALKEEGKLLSP